MAELKGKDVFKKDVMPVKDFAAERGVSMQAVHYAIDKGFVDYVRAGFVLLIVMTKRTKDYLSKQRRAENGTRRSAMSFNK